MNRPERHAGSCRLVLVFNQKGGVGKTTTALNLGAALARYGKEQVTLVDLDPQTHLTAALGCVADDLPWNVSHWLAGQPGAPRVIGERLALIPGDGNLSDRLDGALRLPVANGVVIVDAPPFWNSHVAALMPLADWILAPTEPEFLGLQGISRLLQKMASHEVDQDRLRLLLCRYDGRLKVHQEVREKLAGRFGPRLLPTVIRNSVRLAEAPGYGRDIFDYAPDSSGAEDYAAVARTWLRENP